MATRMHGRYGHKNATGVVGPYGHKNAWPQRSQECTAAMAIKVRCRYGHKNARPRWPQERTGSMPQECMAAGERSADMPREFTAAMAYRSRYGHKTARPPWPQAGQECMAAMAVRMHGRCGFLTICCKRKCELSL